jgi:hypothetical protein
LPKVSFLRKRNFVQIMVLFKIAKYYDSEDIQS